MDFVHGREAVTDYTVLDILTPDNIQYPDSVLHVGSDGIQQMRADEMHEGKPVIEPDADTDIYGRKLDNVPVGDAGDPSRFTGPFPFREPMSPASPTGTDTDASGYGISGEMDRWTELDSGERPDCSERPDGTAAGSKAKPDNGTGSDSRPELALVEFRPFTGRTHQIRVHAAAGLGCPIFGDLLYGGGWYRRMCLHAQSISFLHPITGERMTFTVPPGF